MATSINLTADMKVYGTIATGKDGPVMRRFFRDAKILVADEGLKQAKARALAKPKHPTGSFSGAIVVKDFKQGRTIIADYPQVLYGPWLEGTSSRNTSTRFKGYRIFRLTRAWLRKNLTPILQDRFARTLDELGGGGS